MRTNYQRKSNKRKKPFVIITVVLAVVFISFSVFSITAPKDLVANAGFPFMNFRTKMLNQFSLVGGFFASKNELQFTISELESEVRTLENKNGALDYLIEENNELRNLLTMRQQLQLDLAAHEVVSKYPFMQHDHLIVAVRDDVEYRTESHEITDMVTSSQGGEVATDDSESESGTEETEDTETNTNVDTAKIITNGNRVYKEGLFIGEVVSSDSHIAKIELFSKNTKEYPVVVGGIQANLAGMSNLRMQIIVPQDAAATTGDAVTDLVNNDLIGVVQSVLDREDSFKTLLLHFPFTYHDVSFVDIQR